MSVILPAAEVPGAAQEATSQDILAAVDGIEASLATLATEAKQDIIIGHVDGIEGQLTTIAGHVDGIEGALTTLNAKDFATETTLQKLREWPYASYDKETLTEGATSDTWTFTSGVTTVGTVVINYTDATKVVTQDVTYSPNKIV